MTKETKLTAEQTLANIKEFQEHLHRASMMGIIAVELGMFGGTETDVEVSKGMHNVSHALEKVINGVVPLEALKTALDVEGIDEEDEETSDEPTKGVLSGQIAVNIKTGEIQGIESIKDPELKSRLATVVQEVADKLKG